MINKKYIKPLSLESLRSTAGEKERLHCDAEAGPSCCGDKMELLTFELKDEF